MHVIKSFTCLTLLIAVSLWGQTQTGALSGKIADTRGQGVANTVIIVTDIATGNSQRVVTGTDGTFTMSNLPPGSYRVEVESNGIRRAGRQNVEIIAGSPAQIQVTFEEGGAAIAGTTTSGTVEIRAIAPTIQTDSAEIARAYGTRPVRSLPILDRQYEELIGLMPGVTPPEVNLDFVENPQHRRQMATNGQPFWANARFQDGSYNTEQYSGLISRVQPVESIQQLNIRTANHNAEAGFAGGSWTNAVTRPGTNPIHGSLFFFNTNNFFAARNPLNSTGLDDPRFTTNQFGGTAGGAVVPNKVFIFGSYEGSLRRGRQFGFATVPTADLRAGNFNAFENGTIFNPNTGAATGVGRTPFANNQIPASQISPFASSLLGYIPQPNLPGLTNNFAGTSLLEEDMHRLDGKIDHRLSDRSYGFFRYGFSHGSVDRGSLLGPLGDAANSELRNHNAVANFSHNFTDTLLGEFRFGYNRYRNAVQPLVTDASGDLTNTLNNFGFNNGFPNITISGLGTLGLPGNYPGKFVNNTYAPATNWMATTGIHRLKFGAQVHRIQADGFNPGFFSPRGTFLFGPGATSNPNVANSDFNTLGNSFAAFLTGSPTLAGVQSFNETPTYRQTQWSGYVTDTLNLWQKLHLELGVRYDLFSPVRPRNANSTGFFNNVEDVFDFTSNDSDPYDYDYNNISPRVGFAFSPFNRMAIRGGYSISYFPMPYNLIGVNFASAGVQNGIEGSFGTVPFSVPNVPQNGATGNFPFYTVPRDLETPYVQSYNFMIQTDLTQGFLFDVGYVGTLGRQLPYSRVINAALPGTGVNGLPVGTTAPIFERSTGATNNYNSLQVNLTKRMANSLAFTGAYTWSKALDYGFNQLNPFDRSLNYGPADYDRQHILSISHVWNLPFGAGTPYFNEGVAARILGNWELNGILRWATGTPYTVTANPLFCQCPGVAAVNANVSGPLAINGQETFDPSLFTAGNGFGNLGRNALRGPDLFNYNLSLFRNFNFRENLKFELRGEAYNLTNTANYANPVSNINSPNFGRSAATLNGVGGRQFQVAGRFLF